MGADRELADWPGLQRYFETLAAASDRVDLVDAGPTTGGRRMIAAVVTAPENLARLEEIRLNSMRLSDPRTLDEAGGGGDRERQPVIVAIGMSIHATEIAATQAAPELLHTLATSNDPEVLRTLRDVVLILFPSLNPDGHVITVDWYRKWKGSEFEGGSMPWLYHDYVGHDINRDAFMMNMAENRTLSAFFYRRWHPQVFLTMHQMGPRGARFFVPPNVDPIDRNYDPLIWRIAGLLGHAMALSLEEDGRTGVLQNALYDYYWPGYEDSAPLGHNTVSLLTEAASVRIASPITVAPDQLAGRTRLSRSSAVDDLSSSVARRRLAPARHRGLRPVGGARPARRGGALSRRAAQGFLQDGPDADRARAEGRAVRVHHPAGSIRPARRPQADAVDDRRRGRSAADARTVPRRRHGVPAGHRHHPDGAAVSRLRQDAARSAELPRSPSARRRAARSAVRRRRLDAAAADERQGRSHRSVLRAAGDHAARARADPAVADLGRHPQARLLRHRRTRQRAEHRHQSPAEDRARASRGPRRRSRCRASPISPARSWWPTAKACSKPSARFRAISACAPPPRPAARRKTRGRWRACASGSTSPGSRTSTKAGRGGCSNSTNFPSRRSADADIRRGSLRARFDAIVIPDQAAERAINGHPAGNDAARIHRWARHGGHRHVAPVRRCGRHAGHARFGERARASNLLGAPVKSVTRGLSPNEFFCPGSIVQLELDADPLTTGMPRDDGRASSASARRSMLAPRRRLRASPSATARIVGRYARSNVLLSGWLEGEQVIAGKGAHRGGEVRAGTRDPVCLPAPAPRPVARHVPVVLQRASHRPASSSCHIAQPLALQ